MKVSEDFVDEPNGGPRMNCRPQTSDFFICVENCCQDPKTETGGLRRQPSVRDPLAGLIRPFALGMRARLIAMLALWPFPYRCFAQERPYIVTYDHHLEEPGSLDIEYFSTFGTQYQGNDFHAFWLELEYGAKAWWTTECYLDGQTTFHDSTVFTGFRWENRFQPLRAQHFINPVIYIEYEDISEADKIIKEVEGHDVAADNAPPNSILKQVHNHELEFKLILSRDFRGWNFAINPLAGKNLSPSNPWEFGYAAGISRPLALKASARHCNFCRENFIAGVEIYGGLGDTQAFGLHETSHYLAPCLAWNLPSGWTLRISPGFGLNSNSHGLLLRWGLSREISSFGELVRGLFRGQP
jgi:hypothetical protein